MSEMQWFSFAENPRLEFPTYSIHFFRTPSSFERRGTFAVRIREFPLIFDPPFSLASPLLVFRIRLTPCVCSRITKRGRYSRPWADALRL